MKDICENERPREKMMSLGPEGLSNGELLAIILRNGTREESALDLSRKMLELSEGKLIGLFNMPAERLKSISGIGPCKAAGILAAFELGKRFLEESSEIQEKPIVSARMVYTAMIPRLKGVRHEQVWALFLNSFNYLLSAEQIGIGNSGATVLDVPRVLRMALDKCAENVILVHNHPTGNPRPSKADLEMTESLRTALNAIGLSLLDHVIISDRRFFSFSEDRMYEK